jgi:hypothetical protein
MTMNTSLALRGAALAAACLLAACGGGGDASDDSTSKLPAGTASPGGSPSSGSSGSSGTSLTPAPAGLSGNVTCVNQIIGAVRLDTVIVAPDAACRLEGTSLIGSLLVERGASVEAISVRVNGNVQAEGAAQVVVTSGSRVGGSVQVKQGGSASITNSDITGDIQFDALRAPVEASANTIGGSLQAVQNTGGLRFNGNRMNGNMQCKENQPAPTGSGNVAALKEDQCRDL